MRILPGLLLLTAFALPELARGAAEPLKIAIVPLAAKKIDKETVTILDDLLVHGVDRLGRFDVIATNDVRSILGFEKLKDAVGCDSAQCAADIGGALGVDLLMTGSVSRLGAEVIVSLTLIDVKDTKVVGRAQRRVKNDEGLFAQAMDSVITEVTAREKAPAEAAARPAAAAAPSAPPPTNTPTAKPTAQSTAPVASPPEEPATGSTTPASGNPVTPAPPAATTAALEQGDAGGRRQWGFVALGIAGVAAVTAGTLFLLSPREDDIKSHEYQDFLNAPNRTAALAAYAKVEDARSRHNTMIALGWGATAVAGLGAVCSTYLLATSSHGVLLHASPTSGGAAAVLSGAF